jgi:hypothetical protein
MIQSHRDCNDNPCGKCAHEEHEIRELFEKVKSLKINFENKFK